MENRDKLVIVIVLIASLVLSLFLATLTGILPLATVEGLDAPVRMSVEKYDPPLGLRVDTRQSDGVFAGYAKSEVAAFNYRTRISGLTQTICQQYGGIWEYWNEPPTCYFDDGFFGTIGLDKLTVTKTDFEISCGYCPNSWCTTSCAKFGVMNVGDIQLKSMGIWFKGITIPFEEMNAAQKEVASKNCECGVGGSIWIEAAEPCTPGWQCTQWATCQPDSTQTRTCTDINNCGSDAGKPAETQSCVYTPPEPECITNEQCENKLKSCDAVCTNNVCDILIISHPSKQCPDGSFVNWNDYPQCSYANCPTKYCGNGVCESGETSENCLGDCPKKEEPFPWIYIISGIIALIAIIGIIVFIIRKR